MVKHAYIKVRGTVQGVNFRTATKNTALDMGLVGYVRNEADGSVYIEAEGEEDNLNEFIEWCRQGTEWAKVDGVETRLSEILTEQEDFSIEY